MKLRYFQLPTSGDISCRGGTVDASTGMVKILQYLDDKDEWAGAWQDVPTAGPGHIRAQIITSKECVDDEYIVTRQTSSYARTQKLPYWVYSRLDSALSGRKRILAWVPSQEAWCILVFIDGSWTYDCFGAVAAKWEYWKPLPENLGVL